MTSIRCTVCTAITDAVLCQNCADHLEATLAEMPAWLDELTLTVTRQANTSRHDNSKPTKKAEQPLPYHADAAQLAEHARNGMGSWIRHLCESRGLTVPALKRTNDMAGWLAGNIDAIRQDEAAAEIHATMTALRAAILRMVDNLGKRWAGPCTATVVSVELAIVIGAAVTVEVGEPITEPRQCGADLRTRPGANVITCHDCGATYDPIERARWTLEQSLEHLATAAFIAAALTDTGRPVKANTIRKWAQRGKLFAWREDEVGRPLYRVGDVLEILGPAREVESSGRISA